MLVPYEIFFHWVYFTQNQHFLIKIQFIAMIATIVLSKVQYKKAGEDIDWSGAVYALQKLMNLDVHVEGYTALDLVGIRHNVTVSRPVVYLLATYGTKLPRWFLRTDWQADIQFRTMMKNHFSQEESFLHHEFRGGNYKIKISSPERAILEVIDGINDTSSFEDAANTLDGMLNLRGDMVLALLKNCQSLKVKRVFMFLVRHYSLPVADYLERKQEHIDLGKGILQLVKKGKYIREFNITVPESFVVGENPF